MVDGRGDSIRPQDFIIEAEDGDAVIGAVYCCALGPRQFAHVLSELTIAVHPAHQGTGVGRQLFEALLAQVQTGRPGVTRVELLVRAGFDPSAPLGFWEGIRESASGTPVVPFSARHPVTPSQLRDLTIYADRLEPLKPRAPANR